MRKFFLYLIFGWFFLAQSPLKPGSPAQIVTIVGPFKTESECKVEYAEMKEMVEALGIPAKLHPCVYKQEV